MSTAQAPFSEAARLMALRDLGILDTPPDAEFEALVRAASLVCSVPISLISLIDEQRQWFKASVGLPGISQTPRHVAFCSKTILQDGIFEVPDATQDIQFAKNPLVTDYPNIRFYAGVPLRLGSGAVVGTLCVIDQKPRRLATQQRDILHNLAQAASIALDNWHTRRLKDEQSKLLLRTKEFLDRTGRISGVGGWELDLLTGALSWSSETHRIHGVDAEYQPTLEAAIAFYAPEARPVLRAALAKATAEGGGWDLELPLIQATGRRLWVRAVGAVTLADGAAVRAVGTMQDITNIIAERSALREANERETALFNNSPDILYTVGIADTADGIAFVYETFNPALTKITGWQPRDLIGHRPLECLPAASAAIHQDSYQRCFDLGKTITFQSTCNTPKGTREFEGSITPIRGGTPERVTRLVGVLRDMTEQHRLQMELHHRQKMDTVGRLAAGVAHDFNNILQSVSGSLEVLLDEQTPGSSTHEVLAVGLRSARRGSYLTHHLLSYARKQMLRPRMVALPLLLSDLEKLLGRTLGPHITVEMHVGRMLPPLYLDPGQLETALLNLAINAAHAMPQSGTLTIEARDMARDGRQWVVISVTDTGSGMDAATLEKATEPFFTTKGLNGTGLGLSMVQGFAEQTGGALHISSAPGQGTRAELHLPGALVAEHAANDAAPPESAGGNARILLVDDDPDVMVTTAMTLGKAGFTVIRAGDGDNALAIMAEQGPIDAIISDFAMPGMNGADLVARARATRPDLPAIIISGFLDADEAALPTHRTVILHKPFLRDQLLEAVRRVLETETAPMARAARG